MKSAAKATFVQVLVAVALIAAIAWLARSAPFLGAVESTEDVVREWGTTSIVIYPLLVMVATVLFLPGGILSLGGGFFFGLWWGTLLVLVGNLLGAAVAFYVGRKLGRKFVRKRILRDPRWAALDGAIGKRGPRIIFFSQLNPLFPTSLFNYLYGITNVGFWDCLKWVALGRLPGVFLYCYLGTLGQLGIRIMRGESVPGPTDYFVWGLGLVITVVVAAVLGHTATKVIEDYRKVSPPDEEDEEDGD
ncbi:MAG: TVP38/TMEM64 family protein [Chthoniobacterales bacterium]|nr:TVP38/TMEM64 family protein [Chthoniobacterales bacterium]